jgi:hypothetical protein
MYFALKIPEKKNFLLLHMRCRCFCILQIIGAKPCHPENILYGNLYLN